MNIIYTRYIRLVILVSFSIFLSFNVVFARATRVGIYRLVEYHMEHMHSRNQGLREVKTEEDIFFSFPVSITEDHEGCYIWVKALKEQGLLPRDLTLVYFDPHHDAYRNLVSFPIIEDITPAHWVDTALTYGLVSCAYQVLPGWCPDVGLGYQSSHLFIIRDASQLPAASDLGPVVVSIDFDYFSNKKGSGKVPFYQPKDSKEIKELVDGIIVFLRESGIEVVALNLSISPEYTRYVDITAIRELLIEALKKYDEESI